MAGTVATTGITVVVVVTAASLGVVGSAMVEAQRVAGVADAAALAAADAASGAVTGVPCEQAERVASAGGVRLRACDLAGAVATVSVTGAFGSFPVEARSRAGPPRAVADDG